MDLICFVYVFHPCIVKKRFEMHVYIDLLGIFNTISRNVKNISQLFIKNHCMQIKILHNSIKFYLPRLEGYSEIVRTIADEYGNMSLIEFDGYFEGKLEPVKYTRVEVHTDEVDEEKIISFADRIRIKLKQTSLAYEFNNRLVLISQ